MGVQTAHFVISTAQLLNANDRLHHLAENDKVRDLKQIGRLAFGRQLKPPGERVHVMVTYRLPVDTRGRSTSNLRRDAANWAPTSKALVDGLTLAGIWPDDNDRWVEGPDNRLGPEYPQRTRCEIHITLTPKSAPEKRPAVLGEGPRVMCAAAQIRPFRGGEVHYFCSREKHDDRSDHVAVTDSGVITW